MSDLQDLFHYFEPVGPLAVRYDDRLLSTCADSIAIYRSTGRQPDLGKAHIVIAGLGNTLVANEVRSWLYGLVSLLPPGEVADLGNLREGKTPADTLAGLTDVVTELRRAGKVLVGIGRDSHDVAAYGRAFSRLGAPFNLAVVDPVVDIMPDDQAHRSHYLNALISDEDGNLFDFFHLGYQSYLTDPGSCDRLAELFFEHHRLGALRDDPREAEPVFRNSDLAVLAMNAIRQTEAPGVDFPSANGFTAEEACQLARFAGLSDRLGLFALTGFQAERDINGQTSALAAQIIWHFIQGVGQRKNDYPYCDISQYQKYLINIPKSGFNLTFYKSPASARWWMEIPHPDAKIQRFLYVACSPGDYQAAIEGEVPDRWWNHFRRRSWPGQDT